MENEKNYVNGNDIPLGFGMALAKNMDAMAYFSGLTEERKKTVIEGTHAVNSKEEMEEYVRKMAGQA